MKIGLFFGSFNPVHIGHMAIANYIVEFGPVDQLWFVVSPQNPFKKKNNLLYDFDRLELVKLAIVNDNRFVACDIELYLPKPSYTIDTLTYLGEKYPRYTFFPIIGGDNYEGLSKWKNYRELILGYTFLVYPRPGYKKEALYPEGNFIWVEAPMMELSSTFLREAIKNQHDVRHFLPPDVYFKIIKSGFYS
jgi:nicotinate-nucleotide adenylyltransferase